MRRPLLPLLLAAAMHQGASGAEAVPTRLKACGDAGEFPPFTYFDRKSGRQPGTVGGFNAEYLPQLLAASGRSVDITLLPWKRCLALAQQGEFDLVLDVVATPPRKKQFRTTAQFASTRSVIVYDERRPVPIPHNAAAMASLRRCEILGWDTTRSSGAFNSDKQSLPATMALSFAMLSAGRCDVLVLQREVIRSLDLIGGKDWMRGLATHPIGYLPSSPLHYGVSRAVPYSDALHALLDEGIERMQRSGDAQRILERHLPPEPPVPQTLRACGDAAGFAPYTYAANGAAQGYNVDFLQALLARSHRKINISLLPWNRCLHLAAQGQYDLILDATSQPKRRKDFLLPQSHYSITPAFAFRAGETPRPPASKQELSMMRRCQVAGWDYTLSGSSERPEFISTASSMAAALNMLRHGRCDILLTQQEPLQAVADDVQHRPVPWAPSAKLHFGVSRAVPYAQPLADLLDDGITHATVSGEAARLMKRHFAR